MNNTFQKRAYICIAIITLFVLLFASVSNVYATSKNELQNQQSELDQKINQTQTEIAGVKDKMSTELTQINRLNSQISEYQTELDSLQGQISSLTTEIEAKENEIKQKEEEYSARKETLEKRLVALYESGTTSYLDMLLSSESLSDFISKYYLISELANCDNDLLESIDKSKAEITVQKTALTNKKNEVQQAQETAERKRNTLNLTVSEKKVIVNNLSAEEKGLQEQLEEFEADRREIQVQLARIASKNGNVTPVAPSAAGYGSPLSGKTKANITTGYYGYTGHGGVDFACSAGTPVLAVKAGEVVTSKAMKRSNGTYKSYGEYIVIDHHDGTMTLYAHMLPNSRTVQEGATVSQGQQIGQVGTTGNSTGNHLHFEVRIKGARVNPTQYLP
ncbi:MAG: peptidoglycan DD-metalloendopeptidase family protein [Clostridia bacterium]|nr:peptidoglycan DD-metalloendopeptidase family protein [Clostridia bacterium]